MGVSDGDTTTEVVPSTLTDGSIPTIASITDNVSSGVKTSTVADGVSDTSLVAGDSTTKGVKS